MTETLGTSLIVAVVATLAAAGLLVLAGLLWLRLREMDSERDHLRGELDKTREILATAPDGLFTFDITNGREQCSRRLAVLLGLPDGVDSTYYDLRHCFEGEASKAFDQAIGGLRRAGRSFDLLLNARGRLLHIIGVRAGREDGEPVADLVWMRDVDGIPGVAQPAPSHAEALTAAYDSFQYLLDAMPVPIWLRDRELAVAYANRACGGDDLPGLAGPLAQKARSRGEALSERHRLADGRDMEVTETPVKGWVGTAGFALPATAPAETAAALPRPARDSVLEAMASAVAIFGPDTRLVYFNSAYARLWHLETEWLYGRPRLSDVLDRMRDHRRLPEVADFKAFKAELLDHFETLEGRQEGTLHLPDGTSLRSLVARHPDDGLIFVYEDLTDRLALERDVKRLDAVQRSTLDNLHEGIAVFGGDGRLKLTNPAFLRLWNLNAADLPDGVHVAQVVEKMQPLLAGIDDPATHKQRLVARITGREAATGRLTRADGSILDYADVPLPDGAMLLSYLDVTDSAQVEQALRERANALDEAGRLKSAFIANVSHEIRVPMNTIIGFAETLAEEYFGPLNTRQKEYSQSIVDASRGLMRVVDDILDLASIEAGTMHLDLDSVEVHGMLVAVLGLVRERARRQSLQLDFDCPTDIGWLVGDEKRLKQVLFNLLSNALRFTPARGTVTLAAWREGDEVLVKVADSGIGIPQADVERVFGSFERGAPADPGHPGAGLGLSIVKQFVELHGGEVDIRSAAGKGTTVTCRFPVAGPSGETEVYPRAGFAE